VTFSLIRINRLHRSCAKWHGGEDGGLRMDDGDGVTYDEPLKSVCRETRGDFAGYGAASAIKRTMRCR
jgi:hypothetical protein